ncbi:hypothetical protein [Marinagarivorans algicola]|uniref:DUF7931 domain-containing protein n=1 Tax=Marinagarivorans algicola TaxID=1513270 RepID=UPI0006B563D4|nr:hypothetical protein [Marinagarivorans algicola]
MAQHNDAAITQPPSTQPPQGDTGVIRFDTLQSASDALYMGIQTAQRDITIFCYSLEPALYSCTNLTNHISRVARRHRNALVRILIQNPKSLYGHQHLLVSLSQRLPSSIQIRILTQEHPQPQTAFCISDRTTLVFFNQESTYQGFFCRQASAESRHALETFDHLWQHYAVEDPELKAITL